MLLENAGQKAYAVSLPGVGERADELSPEIGLEDHISASEHLTAHPWKTFTDKLELSDPDIVQKVKKTDIYTKTTLEGLLQTGIASVDEAEAAMVIDTGHDLMITEPELTTDMLLNAAK
ncbi:MAG: hypothetical protein K5894_01120 [Lachnospiraceae bacterium]|nr:hypothetical protein [Lachnospiraceae bacterium]